MSATDRSTRSAQLSQRAADLTTVARFLARRDMPALNTDAVENAIGRSQVDALVLLGNAVLETIEAGARAVRQDLAADVVLVGGIGHSTGYLVDAVRRDARYDGFPLDDLSEAEIIRELFERWYAFDTSGFVVGTRSTNCGANAAEAFALLDAAGSAPRELLLLQDPTMQRRTHASFEQVNSRHVRLISFASFVPEVRPINGRLAFENRLCAGAWEMERFVSLALGEIPRLRDDVAGYGPRGKGFISHVDIPAEAEAAYQRLIEVYSGSLRALE